MSQVVYTDGACRGNPGPGGWAWALDDRHWMSGVEAQSTNQRMEIMAAYQAVRHLPGPLEVRSDSTYVVKCFNDRWYRGWLARGWRNSQKQAVANRDLWEPFIELVLARGDVRFTWVKGHGTDRMNQLVDRLAVEASRTQRGASAGVDEQLAMASAAARTAPSPSDPAVEPSTPALSTPAVSTPAVSTHELSVPGSGPDDGDPAIVTQGSLF